MTTIQWFPGHMAKAKRQISEKLPLIDIVVEVLDARIPNSSKNHFSEEVSKGKHKITVLTKMDIADKKKTEIWKKHFQKLGNEVVMLDLKTKTGLNELIKKIKEIQQNKKKMKSSTFVLKKERPVRLLIMGIPNAGKSTLINALAKRKATNVGDRPGVTKGQQWVKVADGIELLDTPGILWPKFDNQIVGYNLATTGAIKDTILPKEKVVEYALNFLTKHYPEKVYERYGISDENCFDDMIKLIGEKRNMLLKGGEVNLEAVCTMILNELRNDVFSGFTWELPDDIFLKT